MINLSIRHTIADYAQWRAGFDAHATARRTAGAPVSARFIVM